MWHFWPKQWFSSKQWIFVKTVIFVKKAYPNPGAFNKIDKTDTTVTPLWHHGRTSWQDWLKNPIQTQGLLAKMTLFHEILVEKVPFQDVRFVGDIFGNFRKNSDFHDFLRNITKFSEIYKIPRQNLTTSEQWKTVKTPINQRCLRKVSFSSFSEKNVKNGIFRKSSYGE